MMEAAFFQTTPLSSFSTILEEITPKTSRVPLILQELIELDDVFFFLEND
jgi:hypothetical protein